VLGVGDVLSVVNVQRLHYLDAEASTVTEEGAKRRTADYESMAAIKAAS
jgi:hypothetical protein